MLPSSSERPSTVPLERLPVRDVLATVEPFTAASDEELATLASSAVRMRRAAGVVLVQEGCAADGLYVVLRGRVNLVRDGRGPRDLILSALGPGDVIGETCAFDDQGASTSAIAATPVELLRIPPDVVAAHLRKHPPTMLRLMKILGEKLRDAENVASSLAMHDVEQRLRWTLARLVRRQGRHASDSGSWILAPVPTQTELARMVGSCRETVSRTLSSMARDGLLTSRGRRLIVHERLVDPAAVV